MASEPDSGSGSTAPLEEQQPAGVRAAVWVGVCCGPRPGRVGDVHLQAEGLPGVGRMSRVMWFVRVRGGSGGS